jgi:signal peptidase I
MSDELEDSERSRIRQLIRDTISQPTIGQVQEVFVHTGNETRPSNHEVSVSTPPGENPTQIFKRRPVVTPSSGMVTTPQVGDLVLLLFPEQTDDPFIVGNLYGDTEETRAPTAGTGELRFIRDESSIDIDGGAIEINRDNASVNISENGAGESVIKITGESTDVSGDDIGAQINADNGDIVIKNQNGHGIEIPSDGKVTIFGDEIDLNTQNEAKFK